MNRFDIYFYSDICGKHEEKQQKGFSVLKKMKIRVRNEQNI